MGRRVSEHESIVRAEAVPRHIGFIVDGNRRWAKRHGLPAYEGHLAGYNALKDVLLETLHRGVRYASAYVFSTENWKRSQEEVGHLMSLFLKILESDVALFCSTRYASVSLGRARGYPRCCSRQFSAPRSELLT